VVGGGGHMQPTADGVRPCGRAGEATRATELGANG
jgi:hypothetical protein